MNEEQRKEELKDLMSEYKVSCRCVADILDHSINTIRMWRSKSFTHVPPRNELRLLKYELEALRQSESAK